MLQIVDYSEKAIALVGDTKAIKDQLKAIGGSFNPRLSCGAGWIFSAKKRDELQALINGEAPTTTKTTKPAPRVYCGTYHKYNCGSNAGAWLTITDYANGDEVIKACAKLHKDEADHEFMFQDFENFPEWFYSETMHAKDFDEVLKWYKEENEKPQEKADAIIKAYFSEMGYKEDSEKPAKVVMLSNGGFYVFDKHIINTSFCFHDEGPDYEFYKSLTSDEAKLKAYFFAENLRDYDNEIKKLEGKDTKEWDIPHDWRIFPEYEGKKIYTYADFSGHERYWLDNVRDKAQPMTAEDKAAIVNALKELKGKMEKRLESWWKRYGADKLYLWTYWADA